MRFITHLTFYCDQLLRYIRQKMPPAPGDSDATLFQTFIDTQYPILGRSVSAAYGLACFFDPLKPPVYALQDNMYISKIEVYKSQYMHRVPFHCEYVVASVRHRTCSETYFLVINRRGGVTPPIPSEILLGPKNQHLVLSTSLPSSDLELRWRYERDPTMSPIDEIMRAMSPKIWSSDKLVAHISFDNPASPNPQSLLLHELLTILAATSTSNFSNVLIKWNSFWFTRMVFDVTTRIKNLDQELVEGEDLDSVDFSGVARPGRALYTAAMGKVAGFPVCNAVPATQDLVDIVSQVENRLSILVGGACLVDVI